MPRTLTASALLLLCTLTAHAHFVFVVPDANNAAKAVVVFSDDLAPDEAVTMEKIAALKLRVKDAAGKVTDATFKTDKHSFAVTLPGTGARVVYGSVPYGVMQKGDAKPFLLAYHPKAVVGPIPADGGKLGDAAAELVPLASAGKVKFRLLAAGKPVADAEATVIRPDGKRDKVKTDKDGTTPEFAGAGWYGVWVRVTEARSGEHDGKKYEEVRHYPTLVVDVPGK
jgi:uncharacterized GH25 family protein